MNCQGLSASPNWLTSSFLRSDNIAAPREEVPVEIFENDAGPQIPDRELDGEGASSSGDSGFEIDSDDMSEAEEEGFRKMLESFLRGDNPSWSPRSEEEEDCYCAIPWQDEVPFWDEGGSEAGAASNGPEASASPASPATPPATPANDVIPLNPEAPLNLTIQPLDLSMK